MDNLKLYNAVRAVPEEALTPFDNGSFSGTDINPMWRIKTLTEQFGVAGIGWHYEVLNRWTEAVGTDIIVYVEINLYVKMNNEWSKPIYGIGGNRCLMQGKKGIRISDEGYKMALTDALSVSCKALGIGADVYFEKDRTKYTQASEEPSQAQVQVTQPKPVTNVPSMPSVETCIAEANSVKSQQELLDVWNRYKAFYGADTAFKKAIAESPYNPNNTKKK